MPPQESAAAPPSWIAGSVPAGRESRGALRPHFVVLLTTLACAVLLTAITGIPILPFRPWGIVHAVWLVKMMLCGVGVMLLSRLLWRVARRRPINKRRIKVIFKRHIGGEVIGNGLCFVLTIETVLTVFTTIKQAIPFINGRLYDDALVRLEQWLHGGLNPAWLLAGGEGPTWWATVLDLAYYAWFAAMPLSLSYFLTHRNKRKREHMFAAFAGIFIVGVLWGAVFPSHGPCYVDPDRFPGPGMPLCAFTQNWLSERCAALEAITVGGSGGLTFGSGMMALPSLHVAVCVLYVVFFWGEGVGLRWASVVFAMLIFLASMQSGWHYAVDGYGAIVLVAVVTWMTSGLAREWADRPRHSDRAPYPSRDRKGAVFVPDLQP